MRHPDCILSAISGPCACPVCAPVVTDEDRAMYAEYIALRAENTRREDAIQAAQRASGLSPIDFIRSGGRRDLPQPDYSRMGVISKEASKIRDKQTAAMHAELARTAATDLADALANPSFSHLRHTRNNDGLYIYNRDVSSPSGVRLAFTIPLTDEVSALLVARRCIVNDGPSRGTIAESRELRQTFYR